MKERAGASRMLYGAFRPTTFELTAPLRLPLYGREIFSPGEAHPTEERTYKLSIIAMDTPRLEDPSMLFETHALGVTSEKSESPELNKAHIVLAAGGQWLIR